MVITIAALQKIAEIQIFESLHTMENEEMDDPFTQLHIKIQQVMMCQKHLRILIEAEKLEKEYDAECAENIQEKIRSLASEHYRKSLAASVQDITIPTLQLSDTLYKTIVAGSQGSVGETGEEFEDLDISAKKLGELLERISGIAGGITDLRKEIKALEENVLKTQLEIHQTSSEKLQLVKKLNVNKIKEKELTGTSKAYNAELRKEEEKVSLMVNITNNILQKVIAFSGINWAQDNELKAIVVGTGKPIESQLLELEM